MLIAAIDIGTNSIHMVIARATGPAGFEVVDREREVVQVGRGSFGGTRLQAAAVRRTVDALARFVQLARRHQVDKILCTATAAVREARNGGEFLTAARAASGVTPRVIPAEEEGRLIYLAVKSALQLEERPSLVVDIGGGSAQLVVANPERVLKVVSAPLGALRLTETFLDQDPPSRGELQRLARHVEKHVRRAAKEIASFEPGRVYGSSGSIHALAQVAHWSETGQGIEQINGHWLALDALRALTRRLRRMSLPEREKLPFLDAKRAEIILPGAMVLGTVLEQAGADGITLSDFGVREGLVTDYIQFHAHEISTLEKVEDLRLRSVYALLAKFQADGKHPRHVAQLALSLYDGLQGLHRLPPASRELLHYAALLHDIGSAIGYDGHAEHSAYIIRNGNLRGLSAEEVDAVALVARYHGKGRPRKSDRDYRGLSKGTRRTVKWLAAVVRIVEGLDRSHYQLIRTLRVARRGERLIVRLSARRDAQLELWAARRRTDLLADLTGKDVRVALEAAKPKTADEPAQRSTEPAGARRKGGRSEENGAKPRPALAVVPSRRGTR